MFAVRSSEYIFKLNGHPLIDFLQARSWTRKLPLSRLAFFHVIRFLKDQAGMMGICNVGPILPVVELLQVR